MYLLGIVDFDNYLTVDQTQISNELKIHRVNVTKAIKKLRDLNVIVEGPRAGLNKTYRLNPYIAHKGKDRDNTIVDFEDMATVEDKKILSFLPTDVKD